MRAAAAPGCSVIVPDLRANQRVRLDRIVINPKVKRIVNEKLTHRRLLGGVRSFRLHHPKLNLSDGDHREKDRRTSERLEAMFYWSVSRVARPSKDRNDVVIEQVSAGGHRYSAT